jgi:beta-lactamase class A
MQSTNDPEQAHNEKILRLGQQQLTNPILECDTSTTLFNKELHPFKQAVEDLVNRQLAIGKADKISLYFRDLQDGPWFGINEDEKFAPASLLKLPIMITYYKIAETDPSILNKKVTADPKYWDATAIEDPAPRHPIEQGKTYTINQLIESMIVGSDNNAKALLLAQLPDTQKLHQTYIDLGFDLPEIQKNGDVLSARAFGKIFRILYNASYLNKEMSEKALSLLTKTEFNKGIVAQLPQQVTVAHKYGEYATPSYKQLHECGIVYFSKNPYFLCVMTRGKDFPALAETINEISTLVYHEVSQQITPDN